jgi:hypothetical protein
MKREWKMEPISSLINQTLINQNERERERESENRKAKRKGNHV